MLAHIRQTDGKAQSLEAHCKNVSVLCGRSATGLGLEKTAALLGLLHDMGKGTEAFAQYLRTSAAGEETSSPHHHAPAGAIFVYRRWFVGGKSMERFVAQLLSLCIYGHHTGLLDCLNENGDSDFLDRMNQITVPLHYEEATNWFLSHIASEEQLERWFKESCGEVRAFWRTYIKIENYSAFSFFSMGMLARMLLSILVDGDRWDAACFDREGDALTLEQKPEWAKLLDTFEAYRCKKLNGTSPLNQIRGSISDTCFEKAMLPPGIFTLCVPTGGGKTYSSLRFALRHAALRGQQRIFYIIPFNTILDQNAKDIREALSDYDSILEHHSNVVQERSEEQESYRLLTERWDSHIILTSLVQFLNAFFSAPNTDTRRLHRLTNAVLIFDEIQSLPKHCKTLFEYAIQFLARCCHCTVVLCTATQPKLDLYPAPVELMENVGALFGKMQRVEYILQLEPADNGEAARRLCSMAESASVLAVVNTKKAAQDIFEKTRTLLQEAGMEMVEVDTEYTDEMVLQRAQESGDAEILCVHLSTLLCPAHRLRLIQWMKIWLKARKGVLCVSTALIEAGINISFPVVVRSLTGLPSMVQAAGRANRNMEYDKGQVYLWDLCEEKLKYLPDIQNGQTISREILALSDEKNLEMPEKIAMYFNREKAYTEEVQDYPIECRGRDKKTLVELLSKNGKAMQGSNDFEDDKRKMLILKQGFREANGHFKVIEEKNEPVLVPFGEGRDITARLEENHSMKEELFLLRKAQAYTVNVYDDLYKRLEENHALYPVGNTGAMALEDGYYDAHTGVTGERVELLKGLIY